MMESRRLLKELSPRQERGKRLRPQQMGGVASSAVLGLSTLLLPPLSLRLLIRSESGSSKLAMWATALCCTGAHLTSRGRGAGDAVLVADRALGDDYIPTDLEHAHLQTPVSVVDATASACAD